MLLPLVRDFPRNGELFNDFFPSLFSELTPERVATIKLDIKEEENKYLIVADVPGAKKSDISIDMKDSSLEVSVTKENKEEKSTETYILQERSKMSAKRRIYLGKEVDRDSVQAKLEDGILTIEILKAKPHSKKIEIQ